MPRRKKGPILSVRAFLENKNGEVLLLRRAESESAPGMWSFPGGVVNHTESPEDSIERLIKQKTGLTADNVKFLNYQNSLPTLGGPLHCLNMYFKAKVEGDVKIRKGFSEYEWVPENKLKQYDIAFKGKDAIDYFIKSHNDVEGRLWRLVEEAGSLGIPVTKKRLIELQALPGQFIKLKQDLDSYELVRKKVDSYLDILKMSYKRNGEPLIVHRQSRTKSPGSILEKMIRKGKEDRDGKEGIPRHYTTFDDMAGARAVVQFLKDVYTIRNKIDEFPDLKIIDEEDYIKNPRDSGYRALHLTLEVPLPGIDFIPKCEVQIKTIFQHSWSSATHELTYKKKEIPAEYHKKFLELSEELAKADKLTEELRHDIEHLFD